MQFTTAELAKHLSGEVAGDASLVLTGFATADRARSGDVTFAENADYFTKTEASEASAIIVDGNFNSNRKTLIRVRNSRIAFARALSLFFPEVPFPAGVHPTAVIAATAKIDPTAHIGPFCVVGEKVQIGPRCALQGANHIGAECRLGADVNLFPNVTLYSQTQVGNRVRMHSGVVIGADGFGYVLDAGFHRKIPQVGNVIIGDDVEIGANTTVDRGALGPTIIGKGTKIDNHVQIAHNVIIGEHCIIVAQAAIAGSTQLGNYVILGGQTGLSGHIKIGNRVTLAAQSGVMHDIPDGEFWWGTPAQPDRRTKRQVLALQQLPELLRRVRDVEKQLGIKRAPKTESD